MSNTGLLLVTHMSFSVEAIAEEKAPETGAERRAVSSGSSFSKQS